MSQLSVSLDLQLVAAPLFGVLLLLGPLLLWAARHVAEVGRRRLPRTEA